MVKTAPQVQVKPKKWHKTAKIPAWQKLADSDMCAPSSVGKQSLTEHESQQRSDPGQLLIFCLVLSSSFLAPNSVDLVILFSSP